ncbi:MAG: alpha-galactosidase [Demequinaceae bacterium]|nr:alpha-galactosidase [Demequinaceae bacterium]
MARVTADAVHLRSSGVSLVVATGGGRLPRVLHWGADLGDLDDAALAAVVASSVEPRVNGELDDRYPVAILPEHSYGWMHTPGLVGHRDGRDHSTRFEATSIDLTAVGDAGDGEGDRLVQRLTVEAADPVADLALTIQIEMLASGLVRTRGEIASTGSGSSETAAPYTLDSLGLFLPVPREAAELLDFAGRWIRERVPQRGPFTVGTRLRESRRGKPGHDSAFLLAAGAPGFGFRSGEVWASHIAWSGNSRWIAERNNDGTAILGGGELLYPGEIRLLSGESYSSPWIYFTYGDGLDEASSRIHRYLRSRPEHPTIPRPITVNTWEAVYFDHDQARLRALADAAADVGAERFVLDDGWFRGRRGDDAGLGDWFVDEGVYPGGLRPLADYVRGKGLEFGLWVEPEMVNPDSDLARAHPEWIARPYLLGTIPRLPLEACHQQVLDLTHPEAFAYIEERLHALVADLEPAYLKWDHNRDLLEAGSTATGRAIGHSQTLACYRLLDRLHAAFPDLEIESCSGGGARIDLEILHHVERVWASDTNDALERQRIQRWTGLVVPPEMMGCHIGPPAAHTTGRTHALGFRAGAALWGHLGIEWDLTSPEASDPTSHDALRDWVALHKRFRRLLHSGDVVRSDLPVIGRLVHGVVAPDRSEALYAYVALDSIHENPVGQIRLDGLDPGSDYRVEPVVPLALGGAGMRAKPAWWDEGVILSGRTLASHGVQAPALHPEEVALVHASRVESSL